jgi:predicted outer membrane protein
METEKMSKCLFLVVCSTMFLNAVAPTQEPPNRQPGNQPQNVPPRTSQLQGQTASNDSYLITTLLVENENEVALARIALQRAQSPEVKQFAQKMIDDHGQFVQKLQTANTATGARPGNVPNDPTAGRDKPGTDPKGTDPKADKPGADPLPPGRREGIPADASTGRGTGLTLDHERLARDLGRKCLESSTALLNEKQGADFDRCFMGMQVGAHVKAVDMLEVYRTYASESLRPTLEEGLKTVQMHLQHAKDLAKQTDMVARK